MVDIFVIPLLWGLFFSCTIGTLYVFSVSTFLFLENEAKYNEHTWFL